MALSNFFTTIFLRGNRRYAPTVLLFWLVIVFLVLVFIDTIGTTDFYYIIPATIAIFVHSLLGAVAFPILILAIIPGADALLSYFDLEAVCNLFHCSVEPRAILLLAIYAFVIVWVLNISLVWIIQKYRSP